MSDTTSDGRELRRGTGGRFTPGTAGGPGRPAGESRATRLADAFLSALDHAGGEQYIRDFARDQPGDFLRIVARMLPAAVDLSVPSAGNAPSVLFVPDDATADTEWRSNPAAAIKFIIIEPGETRALPDANDATHAMPGAF
ncbi:hypothetical protein RAS1_36300 [Phycisphaerae bacterium RAS1]|nr:hypothetical protein RAS1_36300 [Phycisphaerae bacterium RAS1]